MKQRKRNIQVKFYVDEEEMNLINERVKAANVSSKGAYLRKMAIDGFVVNVDTSDMKNVAKEMNSIGRNINQIACSANTYGISQQDIRNITTKVDEIWLLLKSTLSKVQSARQ